MPNVMLIFPDRSFQFVSVDICPRCGEYLTINAVEGRYLVAGVVHNYRRAAKGLELEYAAVTLVGSAVPQEVAVTENQA